MTTQEIFTLAKEGKIQIEKKVAAQKGYRTEYEYNAFEKDGNRHGRINALDYRLLLSMPFVTKVVDKSK